MTCELRPGLTKPIDALIKYFLEVKPYHTKLLEVVEKYRFNEYISITVDENHTIDITKKNRALCGPVGFGLIWDEECGFDAVECCDLFECIGGYGLIFDNSDLLVNETILNINDSADEIQVAGDHTFDRRIQIKNIPSSSKITLEGDHVSTFQTHKLFLVVPYFTLNIVDITENSFFISGNKVSEIQSKKDFRVSGSRYNDGVYATSIVRYNPSTNRTEIIVNDELNTTLISGYINVSSPNKNNGVYQVKTVTLVNGDTEIEIRNNNIFNHLNGTVHGSIQLRTGLIAPRRVWHFNPDINDVVEYRISGQSYDTVSDITTITLAESISTPSTGDGEIRLYGYRFGAGFDGFKECSTPKPYNVNLSVGEVLNITINRV